MATALQKKKFEKNLIEYKKRYLSGDNMTLDESSTRIMINYFLSSVLGYKELEEIKTEYRIKDRYADYVIQLNKKKHFVVEVKAIDLDITEKHIRQAVDYASNEGIDWVLLTNGRTFWLYKVIFRKPITTKLVFHFDFMKKDIKYIVENMFLISRAGVDKRELDAYWKRFEALEPDRLGKFFYKKGVIGQLRKNLKLKCGIRFSDEDLLESVHQVIKNGVEIEKPNKPLE